MDDQLLADWAHGGGDTAVDVLVPGRGGAALAGRLAAEALSWRFVPVASDEVGDRIARGDVGAVVIDGQLPEVDELLDYLLSAVGRLHPPVLLLAGGDHRARLRVLRAGHGDAVDPGVTPEECHLRLQRLVADQARMARGERVHDSLLLANSQLERFAYTASHDLKEPLRAINGFSRLLQTRYADQLDDSARSYLAFIVDGAERLGMMIGGLGDFSRLARAALRPTTFPLGEVVAGLLEVLRPEEREVSVEVADLPVVWADRQQVQAILEAVITNAVRFGPAEGGHAVRIDGGADHTDWLVTVRDTGVGLDPEQRERAFELFTKLHSRDRHSGPGMGLPIAAMAAARLGGRISMESAPGVGTTVTLRLPQRSAEEAGVSGSG